MRKQAGSNRRRIACILTVMTAVTMLYGCGKVSQPSADHENLSREEIQEEYHVFSLAREYFVDPEELTDAIVRGDNSPWSNLKVYEQTQWEELMAERYGDGWNEW